MATAFRKDGQKNMAKAEVVEVDYSAMDKDQLFEALGQAYQDKNFKLMGKLSSLVAKAEHEEEKAKKEALLAELVQTTLDARNQIVATVNKLVEANVLDGAEGVWFAWDFGEKEEVGINPACRLVKSGRKSTGGEGSGKSSYIANPAKSADLLAQVGDEVMFAEDTAVTIDKQEQTMEAGTTYKEAYDFSTNGGWRNRVRMALLKKAGII